MSGGNLSKTPLTNAQRPIPNAQKARFARSLRGRYRKIPAKKAPFRRAQPENTSKKHAKTLKKQGQIDQKTRKYRPND